MSLDPGPRLRGHFLDRTPTITPLSMVQRPPAWHEFAACAETDPECFFPAKGEPTTAAKMVCRGCSVRVECLTDALERQEQHGVRGGLSPRERRKLRLDPGPVAA